MTNTPDPEDILWQQLCIMYRFVGSQWIQHAKGELKILYEKNSGLTRIVLRDAQLNEKFSTPLHPNAEIDAMKDENRAWVWAGLDNVTGEAITLAAKFKTPEVAEQFKAAFDSARANAAVPKQSLEETNAKGTDAPVAREADNELAKVDKVGDEAVSGKPEEETAPKKSLEEANAKGTDALVAGEADDEDADDILWQQLCIVYRFEGSQWILHSKGELKILSDQKSGLTRIVLRDAELEEKLSTPLHPKAEIDAMKGEDRAWVWAGLDQTTGESMTLAAKFKSPDVAEQFKAAFESARANATLPKKSLSSTNESDAKGAGAAAADDEEEELAKVVGDAEAVSVKPEEETVRWSSAATVYQFDEKYSLRGSGTLSVRQNNQTHRIRVALWDNNSALVVSNYVHPAIPLYRNQHDPRAWAWAGLDFSSGEAGVPMTYTARFPTVEVAVDFEKAYGDAQANNTKYLLPPSAVVNKPASETLSTHTGKLWLFDHDTKAWGLTAQGVLEFVFIDGKATILLEGAIRHVVHPDIPCARHSDSSFVWAGLDAASDEERTWSFQLESDPAAFQEAYTKAGEANRTTGVASSTGLVAAAVAQAFDGACAAVSLTIADGTATLDCASLSDLGGAKAVAQKLGVAIATIFESGSWYDSAVISVVVRGSSLVLQLA